MKIKYKLFPLINVFATGKSNISFKLSPIVTILSLEQQGFFASCLHLSKSIVDDFKSAGGLFMAMSDIDLFKSITQGEYKKSDVLDIINLTKEGIEHLKDFLEQLETTGDPNVIRLAKHLLDTNPQVIEYAERILL